MSGHEDGAWNHPEWSRLLAAYRAAARATPPGSPERMDALAALADAAEEMGDMWFATGWRAEVAAEGGAGE